MQLPSRYPIEAGHETVRLGDVLRIRRGLATGSNGFFCLTDDERRAHGIQDAYLKPVLVSGRNLPDRQFTKRDWQTRRDAGERVWLLWCTAPKHKIRSRRVREYLETGEAAQVHLRTMCRRSKTLPWYAVENVDIPDYLFTYMSKRPLRFVENKSDARALTALLCGWLRDDVDPAWARRLLLADDSSRALTEAAKDLGEVFARLNLGGSPRFSCRFPSAPIDGHIGGSVDCRRRGPKLGAADA